MAGEIQVISDKTSLDKVFEDAGDKVVVVDFYADWCGPCRAIAPKLKKMLSEEEFSYLQIVKVNVDDTEELATEYNIEGLPTFLIFKNGKEGAKVVGASEATLRSEIKKVHEKQS